MSNLVIVESPAKCSKIQGFLGQGWKVIASLGHIRHLKEDLDAVGLDKDFEASWEFMTKEKAKAINQLKESAKSASTIYLASDDDREGELIAYSVALLLKLNPAITPRAVFHEITKQAVTQAVANPRRLDMNKVNAAEARSILDMMVGFTMSPLLWKSIGPALSAGRCQTPALRLVCDREEEIANFQSQSSWKVHGQFTVKGSTTSASWPANLTDELEDEENATTYLEIHHDTPYGKVLTAQTTKWSRAPPQPLITSTLQQQASSLFKMPPKKTMMSAQRLYEAGLITYMRTDRAMLSEEAVKSAQELVRSNWGEEYSGPVAEAKKTKKSDSHTQDAHSAGKNAAHTQDAHEAIRPTHFEKTFLPPCDDWSVADCKLYNLIWLRAIQSTMSQERGDQRSITFALDGDDPADFQWRASWRKTTFPGWTKAATKETTEEDDSQEQDTQDALWTQALTIQPGQQVQWSQLQADPHETKAPPRYTEATLIRELEQRGIGRPSTFASLITTILEKSYVETKTLDGRLVPIKKLSLTNHSQWPPTEQTTQQKLGTEKDRLVPTELGQQVLHFLVQHFDDLFAYSFTSQMESRLDRIAEGQEPFKQVLRDTWNTYKDRYAELKTQPSTVQRGAKKREFGQGLVAVQSKKGPLLLTEGEPTTFWGWPSGSSFEELTEEEARAFVEQAKETKTATAVGELDGHPILQKSGKFGPYVEWNGKRVSIEADDSLEQIQEKCRAKQATEGKVIGDFEIRKGQYGPYMFRRSVVGPGRKFVSVPEALNLETVTEKELSAIFQAGLREKGKTSSRGGSSGRGRGRGGGNGGNRGRKTP